MTDPKEIAMLKGRMESAGAIVRLIYVDGTLVGVQIANAKGIGPHPMNLIGAAERMREWLKDATQC